MSQLETVLKLYTMAMAGDVRSPVPHLFGPPGCGKSTVVEQAAEIIDEIKKETLGPDAGCKLHIINVSRISPLELEGVQMPIDEKLKLLHATYWTQLNDGDILLLDEFLRAMPEVYNGLLDILTSRQVGGFVLPKVFIIAASNSTVAYDMALTDRLLHLPVQDIRQGKGSKAGRKEIANILVDSLGLYPDMVDSPEMIDLIQTEIAPMYDILDELTNGGVNSQTKKGSSVRNLIGQAKLRMVRSEKLGELLTVNNFRAAQAAKYQYILLVDGKNVPLNYERNALKLVGNEKLTPIQALNLDMNLQLLELEAGRQEKGDVDDGNTDDATFTIV